MKYAIGRHNKRRRQSIADKEKNTDLFLNGKSLLRITENVVNLEIISSCNGIKSQSTKINKKLI